ncbi:hypothetical protein N7465_004943 [Penicillium sp. CMV-2018d]|nr:hypothetical protein N7465_004943 [Penicillium sp. CMV-2018d]
MAPTCLQPRLMPSYSDGRAVPAEQVVAECIANGSDEEPDYDGFVNGSDYDPDEDSEESEDSQAA